MQKYPENLCIFFAGFGIHAAVFSGGIVEGQFFSMHVERALQIFLKLGFVELLTDGAYYMPDIQLLVGRSSTEAERKRRERLCLQAQKLLSNSKADICPPENRDKEIREQKCARTNIRTYEVTEEDVV